MRVGIYTNLNKDQNGEHAKHVISLLTQKGAEVVFADNTDENIFGIKKVKIQELSQYADVIMTFGGDGTVLKVVREQHNKSIPIVGVNCGKIGFLTEISKDELEKAVDDLVNHRFEIVDRAVVSVEANNEEFSALNEVLLSSAITTEVGVFNVKIDGSSAVSTKGDGIMLATPTGSTAYSLACNGPVIAPNVNAFIINSICPYPVRTAPIVINDNCVVEITSDSKNLKLVVDGKMMVDFPNGAKVVLKKTEDNVKFIKFENDTDNFYQKITKKLKLWSVSYES